jgi:16S rRNA (adenine1518-N6/adenine1519-N6)-dimethyltransferase
MHPDSSEGLGRMRAKKSLGQNFLVDANIQRKIVDALPCSSTDSVLEIGPGHGALTRHLVGRVGRLVLVELDDALVEELEREWGDRTEVELHHRDFLELDLGSVVEDVTELIVVGNIPYNITAPVIFKLLKRPRPREVLLMVQREVGDRLLAEPGTSEYGAMTVGVRSVATVERVFSVPRGAFRPIPRVDSSVVRIRPITPQLISAAEERSLRTLTRAAFQWRRKQLQKILRDHGDLRLAPHQVDGIASETGWDLTRRPETFSPEEFIRLSNLVEAHP